MKNNKREQAVAISSRVSLRGKLLFTLFYYFMNNYHYHAQKDNLFGEP